MSLCGDAAGGGGDAGCPLSPIQVHLGGKEEFFLCQPTQRRKAAKQSDNWPKNSVNTQC